MGKKMYKVTTMLLSICAAICLLFGVVFVCNDNNAIVGSAETVTSTSWKNPTTNASLAASEDTETGYTHFSGMTAWGDRMYYNEKLTLDSLTVTIGSTNMTAGARFGVGFTNDAGGYTPQSGPFNVTVVPLQDSGKQDWVFFNNTHESKNLNYKGDVMTYILDNGNYQAGAVCKVDGNYIERFISAPSAETRYSITFKYMGLFSADLGDYWQATITLEKGNAYNEGLTGATVLFLESSLNGILDSNRQVYLSAFGMPGDFYVGIVTAEEKALFAAADSALSAYQTKKTSSATASVVTEREAAVSAIANLPERSQSDYEAKLLAIDQIDNTWVPAFNTCGAATYNTDTMYSNLNPTDYGDRIYYNEKVKLDGLTVTIGSTNMVAGSRFGFGFTNDASGYTPETGPFNVTIVPSEKTGQDNLYLNSTHASGNLNFEGKVMTYILDNGNYQAGAVCKVDGNYIERFISAPSAETRYSITFKYMGLFSADLGDYWQATITLEKGNAYNEGLTGATVLFLESSLNGILDSGECYLSAFGMVSAGAFYMGVKTADDSAALKEADAALETYRAAVTNGQDSTAAKEEYLNAISGLPANEYASYALKGTELEELEETLANVTHSVSVTVSDALSWNYKIDVPEGVQVARTVLTSEMRGKTEEYTEGVIDAQGRFVVTTQNITPQYLTEQVTIHFVAYDADGNALITREITYSIREYCEDLLAESSDKALRTALVDLLNYGAEAQKYINANAGDLANNTISAYQPLATAFNASGATDVLAANQGDDVTFTAATLMLEDKVSVYAKFTTTVDEASLAATVQIGSDEADEEELDIQKGGNGTYYVVLSGISPLQYAENIYFNVYNDGSLSAVCRYSVNSYIARKYNDASCGALVKALYSYGTGVSAYAASVNGAAAVNGIQDAFYQNGLLITNSDGSVTHTVSTVKGEATPSWKVLQWDSVGDLGATQPQVSDGVYTYQDSAKTLELNTNTGAAKMEIKGSVEYANGDRDKVSTPWPHLLMQQDDQMINLSQMSSLKMQMNYKVTHCDDRMQGNVDAANLHCAQVVWYISLQNRTDGHAEFGEYMWFGMILYDNREEGSNFTLSYKVDDDSTANTGKMICQLPSAEWSSTGRMAKVGETINIDFDILSLAKAAFNKAKNSYGLFSKSSWADMYIGTMNFGIELPGTYNIGVEFDNVGLMYTKA